MILWIRFKELLLFLRVASKGLLPSQQPLLNNHLLVLSFLRYTSRNPHLFLHLTGPSRSSCPTPSDDTACLSHTPALYSQSNSCFLNLSNKTHSSIRNVFCEYVHGISDLSSTIALSKHCRCNRNLLYRFKVLEFFL